ncbi:MAG: RepB family plasmid replication initiator protein, partial [Selenomonadaceae bacterium]|nr:RepB family plasmid replication initiator protein [Selenomonadaceae bacterium]
ELLLQYQNVKEFRLRQEITREIKLDRLRFFLNVPEGAYAGRLNNFRRFVLDGPIQEINSRSVYSIRYRTIKEGRKVTGFEFKLDISRVPLSMSDARNTKFQNDAIEALKALGFTEQVSRAIFAKCLDSADCFSRINRAQALLDRSKTPIKNRSGFLRRAIEDDWRVQGGNLGRKKSPKITGFMSLSEIFDPVLKALRTPKSAPESGDSTPSVKKNKYNLPESIVQELTEWLENEMGLETAQIVLSSYNLTLEQFREEFLKQ